MEYIVGIDIGGTCTDCVVVEDDGDVTLGKAFSTPPDFSGGHPSTRSATAAQQLGTDVATILAGTGSSSTRRRSPRTRSSTGRSPRPA